MCLSDKLVNLLLFLSTFLFLARFPVEFVNSSLVSFYPEETEAGGSVVVS